MKYKQSGVKLLNEMVNIVELGEILRWENSIDSVNAVFKDKDGNLFEIKLFKAVG